MSNTALDHSTTEPPITISSNSASPIKPTTQVPKNPEPPSKAQAGSDSDLEEGEIIIKQVYSHSSDSEESSPEQRVSMKSYSKNKRRENGRYRDEGRRETNPKDNMKNLQHGNKINSKSSTPYKHSEAPYYEQKKPLPSGSSYYEPEKVQKPPLARNPGYQSEFRPQAEPNPLVSVNMNPAYQQTTNQAPFHFSAPGSHNHGPQGVQQPQFNQSPASYYTNPPYGPGQSNYNNPGQQQGPGPQSYGHNVRGYQGNQNNYPNPPSIGPNLNQNPQNFPQFNSSQKALGFSIQYGPGPGNLNPVMGQQYQPQPQPLPQPQSQNVQGFQINYGNTGNQHNNQGIQQYENRGNIPGKVYNNEATPSGYYNTAPQQQQFPNYSQSKQPPPMSNAPTQHPQGIKHQAQFPIYYQNNGPQPQPQQNPDQSVYRAISQPQYGNAPITLQGQPMQQQYLQQNQCPPWQQQYQPGNITIAQLNPMSPASHQPFVMQPGSADLIVKTPVPQNNPNSNQTPEAQFPFYYKPPSQIPNEVTNKPFSIGNQDPLRTVPLFSHQDINKKPSPDQENLLNQAPSSGSSRDNPILISSYIKEDTNQPPSFQAPSGFNPMSDFANVIGSNLVTVENLQAKSMSIPPPPDLSTKKSGVPEVKKLTFFIDPVPIGTIASESEGNRGKKIETAKKIEVEEKQYKLLGFDRWFRSQEKNLLEKLQKFLVPGEGEKEEKKREGGKNEKEKVSAEKEAQEGKDKEDEVDEFNFESRYFMYNPTQVCNRCKKPGHFEKWCTDDVVLRCMFCLGQHRLEDCTQIVCFNCYGVGHRIRDCGLQEAVTCYRCGKKGHKNTRCGVLLPRDKELLKREKKDYNISTKCAVCGSYGHPICNKNPVPMFKAGYLDDMYIEEMESSEGEQSLKRGNSESGTELENIYDVSPKKRIKIEKPNSVEREGNV